MSQEFLVISLLVFGLGLSLLAETGNGQSPVLPDGKGVEKVRSLCSLCHGLELVAQQRLDRAGWTRVLDQMIEFGAPLQEQDRQEVLAYLTATFGPEESRAR